MRIAFLSYPSYADSDYPLVRALRQSGHEVAYYMVLTPFHCHSTLVDISNLDSRYDILSGDYYESFRKLNSYLDCTSVRLVNFGGRSKTRIMRLWWKLHQSIKRFNPDIVQFTQFLPPYALYYYPSFKGKAYMIIHDPIQHKGEESSWLERLRNVGMKWMNGFFLLSDNASLTASFCSRYHIPSCKIHITGLAPYGWYSFVPEFKEEIFPCDFLFIGRISPYKGIDALLAAMEQLQKSNPEARLVVAGSGEYPFDINQYSLKNTEIVNRFIGIEEFVARIRKAKYVVCPYFEGTQSGIIMSSLALGTPVIASRVGNFAESVKEGDNGLLVTPKSVEALVETMRKALLPTVYETLKRNALASNADERWQTIASVYLSVYQQN